MHVHIASAAPPSSMSAIQQQPAGAAFGTARCNARHRSRCAAPSRATQPIRAAADAGDVLHISSTANQAGESLSLLPPVAAAAAASRVVAAACSSPTPHSLPPLPPPSHPALPPPPAVKHCVRLRESSKYRQEAGSALVSGRDLVCELAPLAAVHALLALSEAQLPASIAAQRYVTVTPGVMQKVTGLGSCSEAHLAAEVALPPPADLGRLPPGQLTRVLVLDGVQVGGHLPSSCVCCLWCSRQPACMLRRRSAEMHRMLLTQCKRPSSSFFLPPSPFSPLPKGPRQPGHPAAHRPGARLAGRAAAARLLRPV